MRRTFMYGLMTAALVVSATSAPRAQGGRQVLKAVLTGGSEAPTPINTGAYGYATITIDPAAGEVTWVIDVFNYPTGLTASHIHVGSPGTAGPVIIDFAPTAIGVSGPFRLQGSTRTVAADGSVYCVVATWNDDEPLNDQDLVTPYAGILGVLAEIHTMPP